MLARAVIPATEEAEARGSWIQEARPGKASETMYKNRRAKGMQGSSARAIS
jgi:hypothetical protein